MLGDRDLQGPGDLGEHPALQHRIVPDRPGAERVHPDPHRGVVEGRRPGQPDQPVFGRDVAREVPVPDCAGRRGHVDDAAGPAVDHDRCDRLHHPPGTGEVDVEHQRPLALGDVMGDLPGGRGDPGVVDQHVHGAEPVECPVDRQCALPGVPHVDGGGHGRGARAFAQGGRVCQLAGRAERVGHVGEVPGDVQQEQVGARLGEPERAGPAEASRGAGDDRGPAGQPHLVPAAVRSSNRSGSSTKYMWPPGSSR